MFPISGAVEADAPAWLADLAPADRDEWSALLADADYTDAMRAAECATARPEWPALRRAIRAMGGIDGLGQIARADVPGGLWRRPGTGVPYDELGGALCSAGFERRYADMTGDECLAELWRAWDAWRALETGRRVDHARDVAEPAATAGERPTDLQPGSRNAGDTAGVPVTGGPVQGPTGERPAGDVAPALVGPLAAARRDVAGAGELPEPDAADVEAYQVAELFGAIGEESAPRLVGGDPDIIRRGLDRLIGPMPIRQRRVRRIPDAVQRERDETLELEHAAEELERERAERKARLRVVRPDRSSVRPAVHAPGRLARALMVGAIAGLLMASVAGLVALVAAVVGADVPALAWTLAMSLPAACAGILRAVLPGQRDQIVSTPATVPPARRKAA